MDWRGILGICLTLLWLGLLGWYLPAQGGWSGLVAMTPEQMGDFLGGAFAPLAFLWLVIGFFLQQKEISQNAEGIRIQAQHTRLDTFMKVQHSIFAHLGTISGYLFTSSQGVTGNARVTHEDLSEFWNRVSNGDYGVFCRELIALVQNPRTPEKDPPALFYGTEVRIRHTENFMRTFETLITEAEICEPKGILKNSLLRGTAEGLLYQIMIECRDNPESFAAYVIGSPTDTP